MEARLTAATQKLVRIGVALCGAALLAYLFVRPPAITAGGIDFNAFYCGARVLSNGADPYQYEPLRTCEHENRHWSRRSSVVAAPLPPYALALLVPIARLPYAQAGVLWFILLCASAFVMMWAIVTLTGLRVIIVGSCVTVAVLLQGIPTGALAAIPLALLCAAAVAVRRERWTAATVLLAVACIEPHVAGPAFLAAALVIREMRIRLAVAFCAIVAVTVAAGGIALNREFFVHVLPEHAAFELGSITQFGLSSMLHNFGVADRTALAIGSAQYALFVASGIWIAYALRREMPEAVVLVPIAFAVTGGTYIHLTQIAAVLPLAFVAVSRRQSAIAWVGIALLTVPWNLLNAITPNTLTVPPFSAVVAGVLAGHNVPGDFAYVANLLAYAGVACTYWSAFALRRRV